MNLEKRIIEAVERAKKPAQDFAKKILPAIPVLAIALTPVYQSAFPEATKEKQTTNYETTIEYDQPEMEWYAHRPPWTNIKGANKHELGAGVLGLANLSTGEIYFRNDMDLILDEIIHHEVGHQVHPDDTEKQNRDYVSNTIPSEYKRHHI